MLTCKELTEVVTEYLEGRMPFWRRVSFQVHLGMCGACRTYLRQMKLMIGTLGALPDTPPPPEVAEAMLVRFRNWKHESGSRRGDEPDDHGDGD